MGSPRETTNRRRWSGKQCINCSRDLPEPLTGTERFCPVCRPAHRVLMDFALRGGVWFVTYRELSMWPLPRTSRFLGPEKVRDLYTRFGTRKMSEDRSAFEFGIQMGRGVVELELSPEQYARLKERPETPM